MQRPSAALIPILSVLAVLMACPILAGPVEDATEAYRRGDFQTAYQLIKPRAEEGDATAQFFLGFMYDEGKGVPQDYAEAARWYRKAAEQGNKAAQHNLGLMDPAETAKWYRRAAEPGTPPPRIISLSWTTPRRRSGIGGRRNRGTPPLRITSVSWTTPRRRSGIEVRRNRVAPPLRIISV